jgi:hypothetical protein
MHVWKSKSGTKQPAAPPDGASADPGSDYEYTSGDDTGKKLRSSSKRQRKEEGRDQKRLLKEERKERRDEKKMTITGKNKGLPL